MDAPLREAPPLGVDGGRRRVTLEFVDPSLEARYQEQGGREGLAGFRSACIAGGVLWAVAGALLVATTTIDTALAVGLCGSLAAMNLAALAIVPWATTMNRQHGAATPMAAANSLGVLVVSAGAGIVPGYATAALLVVALFWFVARTRFVYAAIRSLAIIGGFVLITSVVPGAGAHTLDLFILVSGTGAILLALYLLELARRQVFVQDVIIAGKNRQLEEEKAISEKLLLNVLPRRVVERLKENPQATTDEVAEGTVLFADLVGFTPIAARLTADRTVSLLNDLFSSFDDLVEEHGVEKVKTIGDAYMVVGGIPQPVPDHAARVVALGLAMLDATNSYADQAGLPLALRIGVDSGPVVAGVIGKNKFAYDLWGDTVNSASRMESHGLPGAVQVTESTWKLVSSMFRGEARGVIEVKGQGTVAVWIVREQLAGRL